MVEEEEKEGAKPWQGSFKIDIMIYPCKCPNCGTMVEFDKPIYPKIYPIGHNRARFSARKAKRKIAPKVEVQSLEEY